MIKQNIYEEIDGINLNSLLKSKPRNYIIIKYSIDNYDMKFSDDQEEVFSDNNDPVFFNDYLRKVIFIKLYHLIKDSENNDSTSLKVIIFKNKVSIYYMSKNNNSMMIEITNRLCNDIPKKLLKVILNNLKYLYNLLEEKELFSNIELIY